MHQQQLDIARETTALLAQFPAIVGLDSRLDHWRERGAPRYSACLDIRVNQSQLLIAGEAMPDAGAAVRAAFAEAALRLPALVQRGAATAAARAA